MLEKLTVNTYYTCASIDVLMLLITKDGLDR